MATFTKLISHSFVRKNDEISALRTEIRARWEELSQSRATSVSDKERATIVDKEAAASSKELRPLSQGLKVELPPFDGSILKWRNVSGLFKSVMAKNTHLSNEEKNCLLLKAMASPDAYAKAEAAIQSTSSHEEAFKRLGEHYELNKELHAHHLNEMLQADIIEPVRGDIERLIKRIEKHSNGMKMANGFTASQICAAYLEGILCTSLRLQWRKNSAKFSDPPDLDTFSSFLKQQLTVTSSACVVSIKLEKNAAIKSKPQRSPSHSHRTPPKAVFQTQRGRKCSFCQADHPLFACSSFKEKPPSQRQEYVKKERLCFNCLHPRHRVEDCQSKNRCQECGKKHHTLMHLPSWSSTRSDSTVNTVNTVNARYVLPITAIVTVSSEGLDQKARALLNTGATVSLITQSLANTLKARRISNSSISISGVSGSTRTLYQVELTLAGDERVGCQDDRVNLRAHVVKDISPPSTKVDVQKIFSMPFLDGLPLADANYHSSAVIDMILDVGSSARETPESLQSQV